MVPPKNIEYLGFFTVKSVKNGFFSVIPDNFEENIHVKSPEFPLSLIPEPLRGQVKEKVRGQIFFMDGTVSFKFEV